VDYHDGDDVFDSSHCPNRPNCRFVMISRSRSEISYFFDLRLGFYFYFLSPNIVIK
jgi:hypothetical protein